MTRTTHTPRRGRIARTTVALMAVVALVLAGCARTPYQPTPEGPAKATIGLTYVPDIQFAPFYVGVDRGLFTDEGVEATLRHHGAQEGLFTALVAGQEDYVIAGGDEVVQARSQGLPVVAIGQYYHAYPVVLIVPEASPARSVADLAGLRIGVPGRWGESWFGLLAALAEAGLTEADVDIVEINFTAQAALPAGHVDAVVGFANNDQVQFELAEVPTRTIPLSDDGEVPLVSIVLATTEQNLTDHPDTARAVARGMVAGIEAVVADPSVALESGRTHIPTLDAAGAEASADATLRATLPLWSPAPGGTIGMMDPDAWAAMTTFMLDAGLITTPVDAAVAMSNEYVG